MKSKRKSFGATAAAGLGAVGSGSAKSNLKAAILRATSPAPRVPWISIQSERSISSLLVSRGLQLASGAAYSRRRAPSSKVGAFSSNR